MVIKDPVLPAPGLPQMTPNNTISLNDLTVAGGVFVRIQAYSDAARGDYIKVLWDNKQVKEVLIDDLATDFPVVVIIDSELDPGAHLVSYSAEDINKNPSSSLEINVNIIDGEPEIKFQAPVFSDAVSNVINQNSITANSGTHVHVAPYEGILANDTVVLFWRGMNADGKVINGGTDNHVILAADVSSGAVFLIPENKLEALQDKGSVTASYQVRRSGDVLGVSKYSEVTLDLSGGGGNELSLHVSTGAAITDYDAIHIYPFNQGIVKGPAGAAVVLSIVGDAVFNETSSSTYEPILNETGEASFKLLSTIQGSIEVYAEKKSTPGDSVSQHVRFGPYVQGNGNIQYLNYSSGAPANGLTPCSIYLKTAQTSGVRAEITVVRVTILSGSASIEGYPGQTSADIILNSDKSAEIDIINDLAETVGIVISLPESSGSINRISLAFENFK